MVLPISHSKQIGYLIGRVNELTCTMQQVSEVLVDITAALRQHKDEIAALKITKEN